MRRVHAHHAYRVHEISRERRTARPLDIHQNDSLPSGMRRRLWFTGQRSWILTKIERRRFIAYAARSYDVDRAAIAACAHVTSLYAVGRCEATYRRPRSALPRDSYIIITYGRALTYLGHPKRFTRSLAKPAVRRAERPNACIPARTTYSVRFTGSLLHFKRVHTYT